MAQFFKNMEEYSEGQKKKVLLAASLLTQAHLYIWDEPLNFVDVFSRWKHLDWRSFLRNEESVHRVEKC